MDSRVLLASPSMTKDRLQNALTYHRIGFNIRVQHLSNAVDFNVIEGPGIIGSGVLESHRYPTGRHKGVL